MSTSSSTHSAGSATSTGQPGHRRCTSCHRQEEGDHVVVEGGRRRPSTHPELAAFEAYVNAAKDPSAPVVAACPLCAQPMVGSGPPLDWSFAGPQGPVVLAWNDATKPATIEQVREALADYQPGWFDEGFRGIGHRLFEMSLMGIMGVPVFLWLCAVFIVLVFFKNLPQPSPVYVP